MTPLEALTARAGERLGNAAVITEEARRRTYECDGLASYAVVPGLVVLATDSDEVQAVVALCHELGVPFVARGSGTGLSGGALPHSEGVLVVLSQMRRILDVDPVAQRAAVQPGVTANPGCLMQIAAGLHRAGTAMPIAHTIEVLDASLRGRPVSSLTGHDTRAER